ncbi:MAG: AMP-binding protein, partial [Novosphingobium sp.]
MPAESPPAFHRNIRDPLAERLIGPGKDWELETVMVRGRPQQVFRHMPRNLAEIYRRGMAFGDKDMIVFGKERFSYSQGFARAAALARALHDDFGVRQGTKVAVVMSNRPEWILSLIAITSLGGIAALINSRGVAEEMLRAMARADCQLAILDAERDDIIMAHSGSEPASPLPLAGGVGGGPAGRGTRAAPDLTHPPLTPPASGRGTRLRRIVLGAPAHPLRPGDADFAVLSAAIPGLAFEPRDIHPDEGAVVLFTSGTTGFPKGALLSHGALAASVSVATFMGALYDTRYEEESGEKLPDHQRAMATPAVILGPMFHLGGIMPSLRAISLGTTIHIMGKWNSEIAFDMIETVGMTRLNFVPAMLFDMFKSPRATPELLAQVRYMANGAAPLDMALVEQIRAKMPNCQLSNGYGQTEATAWTCGISGDIYLQHPAACGWAAPTAQVQLRRDDGSEPAIGEPGELYVSSPMVMNEYINDPEATAEALHDGWLASG